MYNNNFLDHVGSDGSTLSDRINATGYSWYRIGENIASGYLTSNSVHNGWMNSSGHRANILNSSYTEIGLARSGNYWVEDFGQPRASSNNTRLDETTASIDLPDGISSTNNLTVYPVPASSKLTINFHSGDNKEIEANIIDLVGKTIFKQKITTRKGTNKIELNISSVPDGQYILKLSNSEDYTNVLIVK